MPERPVEEYIIEKETLSEITEWLREWNAYQAAKRIPPKKSLPWWKYGYSISFDFNALLDIGKDLIKGFWAIFAIPIGFALGIGLIGSILKVMFEHNHDS